MTNNILKILAGLLLVPLCLGFTWQLAAMAATLRYQPDHPYYFVAGGLSYIAVHLLFRKPIFTYVFGHELTHALFAVLFGGSVKAFHATGKGGRVTVTRSNFIITLAPYFFPLYTCAALALHEVVRAAGLRGPARGALVFLCGATFTFHVMLTAAFLRTDQNDIREHGAAFSYPLIYLFNVAFAALLIDLCLAENRDYLRFLLGGIMKSRDVGCFLLKKASGVFPAAW